jgi:hypothetical protein
MCVILQKKYVALILLRAESAVELLVKMLKDIIKMNTNEVALICMGLNFIWSIFHLKISDITHNIW